YDPRKHIGRIIELIAELIGGAGGGRSRDEGPARHRHEPGEVVRSLDGSASRGLSTAAAEERLSEHGRNRLADLDGRSGVTILAEQMQTTPVLLLAAAGAASLLTGAILEVAAIAAVIVLNGAIGYVTESRAE